MRKKLLIVGLILLYFPLFAPPNCELYKGDKICYEGCEEAMMAIRYRQGSWQSQQHFDQSIALCPSFAYSYMEKAVPYLKRGDFITWKQLIDKAVELQPIEYLGYRGWCRLQFLSDYEGAIEDIERLDSLVDYDIGFCQTGDYHLTIALALCYKELGEKKKALAIFQSKIAEENFYLGLYDYYHLGVLQMELEDYQAAIDSFQKQIEENDYMGETYYFLALAHKKIGDLESYKSNLEKAKTHYVSGKFRTDTYVEMIDKIYLKDIEGEISQKSVLK